jgi:hypothetical protein
VEDDKGAGHADRLGGKAVQHVRGCV